MSDVAYAAVVAEIQTINEAMSCNWTMLAALHVDAAVKCVGLAKSEDDKSRKDIWLTCAEYHTERAETFVARIERLDRVFSRNAELTVRHRNEARIFGTSKRRAR